MKFFGTVVTLISIVFTLGCNSGWPPDSSANSPIAGFESSTSYTINDSTSVYESEGDARDPGSRPIGMAYTITEVNLELPYNLFAIEAPKDTYVESQFEVLYFDDQRTQIRANKEKGDSIALIVEHTGPGPGPGPGSAQNLISAFSNPGAKVRFAEQVYELHSDGWYHNGKLVHKFRAKPSSGRR